MFANAGGQLTGAVLAFLFIPIYIKLLGMESFGLIGAHLTLLGILRILDLGMSPAVNRQMAVYSADGKLHSDYRDFVRTFEVIFLASGLLLGLVLLLLAKPIGLYWVNPEDLGSDRVVTSFMLMAVITAFQWPINYYHGALMGLERQGTFNAVKAGESLFNHGGALACLYLIAPRIEVYFTWQIIATIVQVALLAIALHWHLPKFDGKAKFNWRATRPVWGFAAGMLGISSTALLISQMDKLILSKLVSLEEFGYYSLVTYVAISLVGLIITPLFHAMFPRLTSLTASNDVDGVRHTYHLGAQVLSALLLPCSMVMIFFPYELLAAWTGQPEVARNTAPILQVYAVGTLINGMMNPPYALQLSAGWTRIGWSVNTGLIAISLPLLFILIPIYGALGCAAVWAITMLVYMAVAVPMTHRRLLRGEGWPWLFHDILLPTAISLLIFSACRFAWGMAFNDQPPGRFVTVVLLAFPVLLGIMGTLRLGRESWPLIASWLDSLKAPRC